MRYAYPSKFISVINLKKMTRASDFVWKSCDLIKLNEWMPTIENEKDDFQDCFQP